MRSDVFVFVDLLNYNGCIKYKKLLMLLVARIMVAWEQKKNGLDLGRFIYDSVCLIERRARQFVTSSCLLLYQFNWTCVYSFSTTKKDQPVLIL